jgi:hypothetical protein
MRRFAVTIALVPLLLAVGCGSSEQSGGIPGSNKSLAAEPTVRPPSTPSQTSPAQDAGAIIKVLQGAALGLTNVAVQDEDTDPNNLLGRPNGYLSRTSADLPGGDKGSDKYGIDRGLVVEVFADADAAATRSKYIQDLQKGSPLLGTEWHYTAAGGRALIRVSGNVKPSLAKKIEAAAAKM